MSAATSDRRTASHSIKENRSMKKRLATFAAALTLLSLIPISSASAAEPWWQVLTGSRPTNMWEPKDATEVQEVKLDKFNFFGFGEMAAVKVEVAGQVVGCLGSGTLAGLGGPSADEACEAATGFPASEEAVEFEVMLETPYGVGEVQVTGGPAGSAPFVVETPWGPPIELTVLEAFGFPTGENVGSEVLSKGSGRLVIALTNLGTAPVDGSSTPVTIVDELPEGVVATGVESNAGPANALGPVECAIEAADEVVCTYEEELPPFHAIEVEVLTALTGSPPVAGEPGQITVSGGNAPAETQAQSINVSDEPIPFGIEKFSAVVEDEGGRPATRAGSHPFQFTTTLQLNAGGVHPTPVGPFATARYLATDQPGLPRNLRFPLPAGLVGNATALPQCDMATFLKSINLGAEKCPAATVVGVSSVTLVEEKLLGLVRNAFPVFNLPPASGEPARFGFVAGAPILINTEVDPENDYRITARVSNTSQVVQFLSATTTLWGAPNDPRHDESRGDDCLSPTSTEPCERPPGLGSAPFLRMPVQCSRPLDFGLELEPWNVPIGSQVDSASYATDPLVGCNRVPFDPRVDAAPSSKLAEAATGLSFKLSMPNSGLLNGEAIAEGQPKRVEAILPEGMTLNPSAAEGLATCSPSEYAREKSNSRPGEGCPDASKIGNVQIESPLIEETVKGALYQATPEDNPFDSLLALYIVARSPERGILVKLAGEVKPDPKTGQIITVFDDAPQLPFSSFDLNFREGARGPLVTPPTCGTHEVVTRFTPWSAQDPDNPKPSEVVTRTSTFEVQRGVDGGACPPGGTPPFNPGFEAGSLNNNAGSFSPFYMRLTRSDGEQGMTKFSSVLPPGVLGSLAGVAKCPEAAIAAAGASSGKEELASPSCPAGSKIGSTVAGAGVGSVLTYVPGSLYLAGPHNGAPLSVVAVTPAVAGPFDVGTVVVREALDLDPRTAEVQVDGAASDPIPHILAGIPLRLRDLRIYVDRDNFTLNPTSCEESQTKATLFGSFLDLFGSADDVAVDLAARYQAANCANLGFSPRLGLKLKGGTRRGNFPGLKSHYRPTPGHANIKDLVVRLPRSAFLEQGHIRTICTRVQFAADNCPKGAQYGYIRAWTPLLDEPLQGPVWLRSSNHKLPDLVFDLHGLVDVEVQTRIDSVRGGIRARVENAPDAPISRVILNMQGGKKGLIVNSRNLCTRNKARANVKGTGQNGKQFTRKPVLRPQCGKRRKAKRSSHSRVSRVAGASAVRD